ncbi:MAG: SGNH/GDSL hydrolase family protein [Candidatus Azobacteroides sp.]|nr:SGNH/GDSL hydrolase family protein [Candidatus Azobacteroides sp.]
MNRRNFFRKATWAGAAAVLIPEILKAAIPEANAIPEIPEMKEGTVILFQGDSITDAGRNRKDEDIPNKQSMLGYGYVLFASAKLLADNGDKNLQIYNRGISGNKVYQLRERWEKDCINLKPDVLSILIGVNDFWHQKNGKYEGDLAKYDADYRDLIDYTKNQLPSTEIIICEPFIIAGGTAIDETWEDAFSAYRNVAKQIAKEYNATFVPFQKVFNEAIKVAPTAYWGEDGVHPSMAGAQLMAQAWLKIVES